LALVSGNNDIAFNAHGAGIQWVELVNDHRDNPQCQRDGEGAVARGTSRPIEAELRCILAEVLENSHAKEPNLAETIPRRRPDALFPPPDRTWCPVPRYPVAAGERGNTVPIAAAAASGS
jgi:hypothetical protein